jgi:type II secretory pathway component PulF
LSTSESGQTGGSVTLDQFIALNDELAALVRAGVPLEGGLIEAGRDIRGRLGAVSTELGLRMGEGMRLSEAIAASGGGMPIVYRAVVEAGVRSGRLSQALEGMASIARGYAEARRAVGMALFYPMFVLVLAYALALFFVTELIPRFVATFQSLGLTPVRALVFLERAGQTAMYWGPILPVLLALMALRWVWLGRSMVLDTAGFGPLLNRLPLIESMIESYRAANFTSLLALLIEHRVPLDEAVRLAGEASGDRNLRASAGRFAETIRQGGGPEGPTPETPDSFPPLLSWMLSAGHRQGNLPEALGHLALTYQRRARSRAEFLKLALPSLCIVGIGAGAVMVYALMLFIPMLNLWNEMAVPVNR